jgi:hypothetical protein
MNSLNSLSSPLDPISGHESAAPLNPIVPSNNALLPLSAGIPTALPRLPFDIPSHSPSVATATPPPNPTASDGVFFVGSTGEIEVSFLADSGLYHSQIAFFSLTGMEKMKAGSEEYVKTALRRAASNSQQGRLVLDDFTEGARLIAPLGETNFNDGVYQGIKKFRFKAGDKLGMLMVANGTLADALADPAKNRPLFSIASANTDSVKQFGQLRNNVFGWEDIAGGGDRDFNDLVLSVGNLSGATVQARTLMAAGTTWYNLAPARPLFVEPSALVFDTVEEFTQSGYGLNIAFLPGATIASGADGTWNQTVNNFDVPAFVADVAKTGAAYVIFSVGQTSGFYASPSDSFREVTGTAPGEYDSTRDLVKEVAQALKKIGIATMVYLSAEGPTAAPEFIRNNFPIRDDRATDPTFQYRFNNIVKEWSQRWGDDVAGWWFDGAWVDGYTNPVNGRANLNALIRAAKAGNPKSLVSANASSGRFVALSDRQDFLSGENVVFDRYPSANHTGPAWHAISYLGNTWSEGSATRYGNQQLIDYVQTVNRGRGVVTMDVAVNQRGRISAAQLAQLAVVKSAVRPDWR